MAASRDRAETVTLTTCFALRNQRRFSSSCMVRGQISGEATRKIDYRNDPVKYVSYKEPQSELCYLSLNSGIVNLDFDNCMSYVR